MQKIKRFDDPPSIEDLINSHRMTVKAKRFSVTSVRLVNAYFEFSEEPQTLTNLRQHASLAGLTAVRVQDEIIFRKAMRPMEDPTEVLRASGDVGCEVCGFAYRYHPEDSPPNEFLNVLCNGRRVKL